MTLETTNFRAGELTITEMLKSGRQVYDGEALWKKYHAMGRAATYDKLAKWATSQDMKRSKSKKATRMGVYFAMWRYALRNPEAAYPAYEEWANEYKEELTIEGVKVTFEMFLKDIEKHARTPGCIGPKKYFGFCKKYGLTPKEEVLKRFPKVKG